MLRGSELTLISITNQKDRAIEALRLASQGAEQFDFLLEVLARWLKDRTASVSQATVTLHENSLAFVVVQKNESYDEKFQDDLSDLEFAIAQDHDLNLITLRTVLLPPVDAAALASFLDSRLIFTYRHGQRA